MEKYENKCKDTIKVLEKFEFDFGNAFKQYTKETNVITCDLKKVFNSSLLFYIKLIDWRVTIGGSYDDAKNNYIEIKISFDFGSKDGIFIFCGHFDKIDFDKIKANNWTYNKCENEKIFS